MEQDWQFLTTRGIKNRHSKIPSGGNGAGSRIIPALAGLWSEASLEGNAADRSMPVELKFSSAPFHQLELMEPAVGFEPTTA